MSTDRVILAFSPGRKNTAGVALVVTLSLLVLVTVAVVAFFSRTATNQQITTGSASSVTTEVYANGMTQAIVAGLQQEMLAGSRAAPDPKPAAPSTGQPYIMPLTNSYAVSPSRSVRSDSAISGAAAGSDPNAAYFQFANLVKQSAYNVYTYNVPAAPGSTGGAVHGEYIASDVKTSARNPVGRAYDGTFWNQPKLISVPSNGTNAAADLEPLIPYWVYTDRTGSPVLPGSLTGRIPSGTALSPGNVVGRYAYNIYNVGGLLDANIVSNGLPQNTAPSYTGSAAMEIVPGYKGSMLTADLSGLTLNGALQIGGTAVVAPGNWQQLPKWRAAGNWTTNPTSYNGFAYVLAGGQFSGWLNDFFQPFDPLMGKLNPSASYLTNNRFTSRQDLINWVNTYWNPGSDTSGKTTWMLPYLTHFSYDTDAPTFVPDRARPKVQTSATGTGENDAVGLDDAVNLPFVGTSVAGSGLLDVEGNPLVKRRFPLSALALIANYGPGNPPPADNMLAAQIQYDFGLVWDPTLIDPQTRENAPGWSYQDVDGTKDRILKLSEIGKGRSPNFFELLKAAITVGSLGKQYGHSYDQNDSANEVSSTSRFGTTANQIFQIGANIISQASTNYTPTHIKFAGTNVDFYGVQDFPYLYRSRHLAYPLELFTGDAMAVKTPLTPAPVDPYISITNSYLSARVVQTELWNPHSPNQILNIPAGTGYPKYFRVVPTQFTASYSTGNNGQAQWKIGSLGATATNYSSPGGVDCTAGISYPPLAASDSSHPPTYLQISAVAPGTSGSSLTGFREPCALINADVTPGLVNVGDSTAKISNFVSSKPTSGIDLSALRINGIPAVFSSSAGNTTGKTVYGFNLGYFCAGPNGGAMSNNQWLAVDYQIGGQVSPFVGMSLSMQYSYDGTNYYTYDVADSAGGYQQHYNNTNKNTQFELGTRVDPRTHRWGMMWIRSKGYAYNDYTKNEFQGETAAASSLSQDMVQFAGGGDGKAKSSATLSSWYGTYATVTPQVGYAQTNQAAASPPQQRGSGTSANATYYQDPDGVVRLADGAYTNGTLGLPLLMPSAAVPGSTVVGPVANLNSRPTVLNRPFQSVAELGYVFRDTPWKSLDFFTPQSGDNALLDVFTAYGPDPWSYAASNPNNKAATFTSETGVVTGRVDLNTAQAPVLAALIQGTLVNTPATTTSLMIDSNAPRAGVAANVAKALVAWTHKPSTDASAAAQGPLRNRAEIVGKYVPSASNYSGFSFGDPAVNSAQLTTLLNPLGTEATIVKQQRECIIRALADVGTTRTWNVLIDVVAQTGRLTPGASGLKDFVVVGERHQWVSVAIDRVTGRIIKIQAEPVRS